MRNDIIACHKLKDGSIYGIDCSLGKYVKITVEPVGNADDIPDEYYIDHDLVGGDIEPCPECAEKRYEADRIVA